MALAMLRMENSSTKWRAKLHAAIAGHTLDRTTKTSNYVLFLLPFITVLREGLESVVFVAGLALGSDPSTIPGAVLLGVLSGLGVGLTIWMWGTHSSTQYSSVDHLFSPLGRFETLPCLFDKRPAPYRGWTCK